MNEAKPSGGSSILVLVLLSLAYVLNFVDRQVLAIVAGDVKAELGLSDFQLSLLLGPAFVLCFTLSGFLLSHLADTRSRKWVLTAGLTLWSLLTAACGLATSFGQIAALRFGVGFGNDVVTDFDANPTGGQDRIDIRTVQGNAASPNRITAIPGRMPPKKWMCVAP